MHLILMMVAMVISTFALIVRATRREKHLSRAYETQMEKTLEAERKNMKQSLAFASINHDVRGYLGCINILIEMSLNLVSPSSDLASNLTKINNCTQDLLALVNSVLDYSKVEAGKMKLEEKEFNIAQLVEDVADLHYAIAKKKGVDVILDTCDGSILRYCLVKGDQAKLKQILTNLLTNAVKFTSQGHVLIRARAYKRPNLEKSIVSSTQNSLVCRFSRFFYDNEKVNNEVEEKRTVKQDPDCLEFEFEVEDTGSGIPKDKRGSIFENFVQVEKFEGEIGTGLGLGIVQSFVRLMGGDIEIVDKADGEKGSCFKFNILISEDVNNTIIDNTTQDKRACRKSIVVLLIKNDVRRKMVKRYMRSQGIKSVVVVRQAVQLSRTLKQRVKATNQRRDRCILLILDANEGNFQEICRAVAKFRKEHYKECIKVVWLDHPENRMVHFPGLDDKSLPRTDCIITAPFHGSRLTRVLRLLPEFGGESVRIRTTPISCLLTHFEKYCADLENSGSDEQEPKSRKRNTQFGSEKPLSAKKVLIVGKSQQIKNVVNCLSLNLGVAVDQCDNGKEAVDIVSKTLQDRNLAPTMLPYDYILMETEMEFLNGYDAANLIRIEESKYGIHIPILGLSSDSSNEEKQRIIIEARMDLHLTPPYTTDALLQAFRNVEKKSVIVEKCEDSQYVEVKNNVGNLSLKKPLMQKKFLIAEDILMLRKIVENLLSRLGASVEHCTNGKEAFELICKALSDVKDGKQSKFPYDYVLMDCKMPIMDGFEATRKIREEEKKYNIHIPIIALTADGGEYEGKRICEAGMDYHLMKPLNKEELLKVMKLIHRKLSNIQN